MDNELQFYLQQNFQLPEIVNDLGDAENYIAEKINELIKNDFNHLIQVLYRIDVNEARLKQVLKDNPYEDAGKIIAALIMERQLQKIKSRKQFNQQNNKGNNEEKW
jgi:hypothetical protein